MGTIVDLKLLSNTLHPKMYLGSFVIFVSGISLCLGAPQYMYLTGYPTNVGAPLASYPYFAPSTLQLNVPSIANVVAPSGLTRIAESTKNAGETAGPTGAAALAYMASVNGGDICAQSAKAYIEVILRGGSVSEAKSSAGKLYFDNYYKGLAAAPGSACDAGGIAWQNAEASGKDPVLPAAIAYMDNSPSLKNGSPCAVAGRDYISSFLEGATATEATFRAAKSFAGAFKKLGAQEKELKDPACVAAMKAFENGFSSKTNSALVAAMNSFTEKAFDGFSAKYDPLCWKSTEAFSDSYASGNTESQSTSKAARVFIDEVANGVASIPADSPCAAATRAYAANVNPSSPAVKAAMEAFINQVTAEGGVEPDSACASAAASYLDAHEAGAT